MAFESASESQSIDKSLKEKQSEPRRNRRFVNTTLK